MAYLIWDTPLFVCAICQRQIKGDRAGWGRDEPISPVCLWCEKDYGSSTMGSGGTMKDRRIARQLRALATALAGEAGYKQWRDTNGEA